MAMNGLKSNEMINFIKLPNNKLRLSLAGNVAIHRLPTLKYLPITELDLSATSIFNSESFNDLSLQKLNVSHTKLRGIGFCHKMPLTELHLSLISLDNLKRLQHIPSLEKVYIPRGARRHITQYQLPDTIEIIEED